MNKNKTSGSTKTMLIIFAALFIGCGLLMVFVPKITDSKVKDILDDSASDISSTKPTATSIVTTTTSPTPSVTHEPIRFSPTPTHGEIPINPGALVNIKDLIGKPMPELEGMFSTHRNDSGSISVENAKYHLVLNSLDDQNATFAELSVKQLGKCNADKSVSDYVDTLFKYAGLDPTIKGQALNDSLGVGLVNFHDYENKYKVSAGCTNSGGLYSISISTK